ITTDDFLARLPEPALVREALRYVDEPGLPEDAPRPTSKRLEELRTGAAEPRDPTELLIHLQSIQPDPALLQKLDARHGLSARQSLELRHSFVLLQLRAGVPEGIEGARRLALEDRKSTRLNSSHRTI